MLLLLLLSLLPSAPPVTEIPFEFTGYHTFIDVEGSGQTLSFVFDTGAAGVGLNEATARRLGIEGTGSATVTGVGGSIQIPVVPDVSLGIGDLRLEGIPAGLLPMTHLEEYAGRPIDGIIGSDLMRGRVVVLDHDRKVIQLHPRKRFAFSDWGEPCALEGLRVKGQIRLLGGETLSGDLAVDTGAGLFFSANSPFVRKHDLTSRVGPTHERTRHALTGVALPDTVGRIAAIAFCGHRFPPADSKADGFPVGLSGVTAGVQAKNDSAGLLGNAVLKRFNIVLDVNGKRMFLKRNSHWNDPVRFDASGLRLIRRQGVVAVAEVVAGSPGDAAGLTDGDRLASIDDTDVSTLTLADLRRRLEERGKPFRLVFVRDGASHTTVLESRNLFESVPSP